MALADPQSIKIGEVETSLPRVVTGAYNSSYESEDGAIKVTLASQNGKRKRQTWRVDLKKITPDPFIPDQNQEISMSFYIVVDRPVSGYTNAEALAAVKGALATLTASSDKVLKQLLANES